jgi:subtilisin family serine protease
VDNPNYWDVEAGEWVHPAAYPYRMWWLQGGSPLETGSGDVADPTKAGDVYLADFSSRALAGQDLDVLAPGTWVRGPYPATPGYNHLPWWANGLGDYFGHNVGNFYYVGGTSMASPHVAAAAALLLEKDSSLVQAEVDDLLSSTALTILPSGADEIFWLGWGFDSVSWDTDCEVEEGTFETCDPVGAGLIQVDDALAAVTP